MPAKYRLPVNCLLVYSLPFRPGVKVLSLRTGPEGARGSTEQTWLGLETEGEGPGQWEDLPIFHGTEMETYLVAMVSLLMFSPMILGESRRHSSFDLLCQVNRCINLLCLPMDSFSLGIHKQFI